MNERRSVAQEKELSMLLSKAVSLHRHGELTAAQGLYAQILKKAPHHFDALHLQGVVWLQLSRFNEAAQSILRAIRINPLVAEAYTNYSAGLRELNRPDQAIA